MTIFISDSDDSADFLASVPRNGDDIDAKVSGTFTWINAFRNSSGICLKATWPGGTQILNDASLNEAIKWVSSNFLKGN